MPRLLQPDELTAEAFKRIGRDKDGERALKLLRASLAKQDEFNRSIADGVLLRQGQGASQVLAEAIALLEGKTVSTPAISDTRQRAG